jgi:organic radical activating enzyme
MLAAIGVMSKKVGMQNYILHCSKCYRENASKYAETVVVTGGEPLMWDMSLLHRILKMLVAKVHIRNLWYVGTWDWICLSKINYQLETVYNAAIELKVIIHNKHDFIFAEEQKQN